jgi:hypothetical protein
VNIMMILTRAPRGDSKTQFFYTSQRKFLPNVGAG